MKLHVWKTVSGLFFTVAVAAVGGGSTGAELGCSTTASGGASSSGSSGGSSGSSGASGSSSGISTAPAGCALDATLSCVTGADGISCPAGTNPESGDPTLSCSTPVANGSSDSFCCFTDPGFPASTCTPDDLITSVCPDPTSYGYVCASGDDPTSYDAFLNCSVPTPDADGVHDDYCCTYVDTGSGSSSGSVPAGCTLDTTLNCVGGADGYACAIGSNPETEDPGLSCSTPALAAGEDDYCCYSGGSWSTTTCEPDDTLTSVCPDPTSYGYVCASGDDPTTYDATLNCSVPTPDADGVHDDFCCTY